MLLNYLDSAIGFVVVILMFSLVITIVVQMVGILLQLRGKSLLNGVELLLKEVDPALKSQAHELAKQVLSHPAIADGKKLLAKNTNRLGIALRPNELKLVLESLAASNPSLKIALTESGAAISAKIDAWYEPVMDRVSEHYKMNTRWVATLFAVILAFGLQIDSIGLFQKISTNAEIRAQLVAASESLSATSQKVLDAPVTSDAEQRLKDLGDQATALTSDFKETQLQLVPKSWSLSFYGISNWRGILGVILSAFLLGLGAPFWYGALRNLVGLRHVVDQKDDEKKQAEVAALAAKK